MKVLMTSVFVPDPLAAHKFYTEVLGFQSHTYMPEHYLAVVIPPDEPNGTTLMLEPNQNPIAKTYQEGLFNSNIPCMVFGTNDLQKDYETLTGKGVEFTKPPAHSEWGFSAIFKDGFGNLILLQQTS